MVFDERSLNRNHIPKMQALCAAPISCKQSHIRPFDRYVVRLIT